MIIIIDYGMGNLGSIVNMFKRIGVPARISAQPAEIEQADKLILPGVGAFDTGMKNLAERGLLNLLNDKVLNRKTPTLGLCLGMQLLVNRSEEGSLPGLGWIEGESVRFRFNGQANRLKVPHMGWNTTAVCKEGVLFQGLEQEARFYFVHSYHVVCQHQADVLAVTHHGYEIVAAVEHENIMGTQFHPEKSHKFGMRLLKNFADL